MKKGYWTDRELQREWERLLKGVLLGVAGLLAVALVVFAISFVLKNHKPVLPAMQTTESESSTEAEEQTSRPIPQGWANFLIYSFEPKQSLDLIWFIELDLDELAIRAFSLDPASIAIVEGQSDSLQEHFLSGDAAQLNLAVSTLLGKEIDRYAGMSDKNFIRIIRELGPVEVYVEQDVYYVEGDISLQLRQGLQKLDYNNLSNYLKYALRNKRELLDLQADAMTFMLDSYLREDILQKGEPLFTRLINLTQSDISAYDYFEYLPVLEYMVEADLEIISGGALTF